MRVPNWFVGLPIGSAPWLERLSPAPVGVRLGVAEDLHITIAFLGPVGEQAAAAAFQLASDWPLAAMEASLDRVVPLGRPQRPSAFGALLAEPTRVADAIGAVRIQMCRAAGAACDARPPLPHVTVARPLRKATAEQRLAGRAWATRQQLADVSVRLDRIALFTWSEDRRSRQFRIVQELLLPASPTAG